MSVAASLIATTMNASTPLLLAALGILVAERSGVLNLGVEGIMLMAAIAGYMATVETGSFAVGFIAAVAVGILFALFFAIFAVGLRANQQASGLGVAIFGGGLSAYIGIPYQGAVLPERTADGIPFLDQIPFLGQAFFSQHWIVYLSLLMIPAVWYFLFRTRPGLVVRAVGESPFSANALGYSVPMIRCATLAFSGALYRAFRRLFVAHLYTLMGGRHDCRQRLDCAGAGDLRYLASVQSVLRRVLVRRHDHAADESSEYRNFRSDSVYFHGALCGDDYRFGADFEKSDLDSSEHAGFSRKAV